MDIPLYDPFLDQAEEERVKAVMEEDWISHAGDAVAAFEETISSFIGVDHGVALDSGSAAIQTALEAAEIGPGDEVLVPDFTFPGVLLTVRNTGATPRLVDIEADTFGMAPGDAQDAVSDDTAAMVLTHLFGQPARTDTLCDIAADHNLVVIEDAAQALGTVADGQRLGGKGDIGCFSFSWNKTLTTGKGGMLVTDNAEYAEAAKATSLFGRTAPQTYGRSGHNYRMDSIRAAIGLEQFNKLDEIRELKKGIWDTYREHLPDSGPQPRAGADILPWLCYLLTDQRAAVIEMLEEHGTGFRRFYPPLHTLDAAPDTDRSFPEAERLAANGVMLPTGPTMTEDDVRTVADIVNDAIT